MRKYRLGVSYKKTLNHPKAALAKRSMFCQRIAELKKEDKPIVYIDESGFAHDMPRIYGYSIKGGRCYGKHDWGAKGRTNAIGALIGRTIIAIGLIKALLLTQRFFTSLVEQILLPELPKESVIIMDNAAFCKGKDMQKILENSKKFWSYFAILAS